MKKILSLVMVAVMLCASIVGCSSSAPSEEQPASSVSSAAPASTPATVVSSGNEAAQATAEILNTGLTPLPLKNEKPVIGWVETRFNHPWRVAQMNQFQQEMERLGVDWDLTIIDGNNDPNKQVSDIEDLIAKDCDIILLSPVTSEELATATKKVRDAGIPMIIVDRYVDGTDWDYAVEVDNTMLGVKMAESIVEDANGAEVEVVCFSLPAGSSAQIDQDNGFNSVIANHPNIKIVATYDTKGDRQTAMEQAEASLIAYPDAWYYTQADEIAFSIIAAAKLLDKECGENGVHIYTANHSREALKEVKAGNLMCVVTTPLCAIEACNLVNQILLGEKPPFKEQNGGEPEIIICESSVITQENASEFETLVY